MVIIYYDSDYNLHDFYYKIIMSYYNYEAQFEVNLFSILIGLFIYEVYYSISHRSCIFNMLLITFRFMMSKISCVASISIFDLSCNFTSPLIIVVNDLMRLRSYGTSISIIIISYISLTIFGVKVRMLQAFSL